MVLSLRFLSIACGFLMAASLASGGELELMILDAATGKPVPARVHIKNQRGTAPKVPKLPTWNDHFACWGKVILTLPKGKYDFEIERGLEYRPITGNFVIEQGATDNKTVELKRFVDMKKEGWWSGDLHIHRDPKDMDLLMESEDLHIGPTITWWNDQNLWKTEKIPDPLLIKRDNLRFTELMAGEDERAGGALLFFGLPSPLPIIGLDRDYPCGAAVMALAKKQPNVHIDAEKPFWWDFPVWVATGQVDSVGIANNHQQRSGMLDNEAWGRPRDKLRYASPWGNGRWSVDIYYHLLNCGLRIPPSAGSASGVLPNPPGYNRVYVHCGDELTWEKWWEGLRAGRVVITNGPMLRPSVEGHMPGHIFQGSQGQDLSLETSLNLATREKIDYLEIIRDGQVVEEVRLDQLAKREGKLPPLKFNSSGWFLIRAVTNAPKTFRFAMTGPYYVDFGKPRISRRSAQFFVDWVLERQAQIKLSDPVKQERVMAYHLAAEKFWKDILSQANAD